MWFLWSKPLNYQEQLISHASDERRNGLRRKRKVEKRAVFWQTKIFFARRGECWPSSKGPPLWNFCTYEELFLPFSIFSTHWYAYLQGYMYTNTSQGEHCATPPPNPNTHSLKAHSPSLHEFWNHGRWWAELFCCKTLIMRNKLSYYDAQMMMSRIIMLHWSDYELS